MQSKKQSLIEAMTNTGIGYVVSVIAGVVVYPAFGLDVSLGQNAGVSIVFTCIAIMRSFIVRRWFNYRIVKGIRDGGITSL